jgi:hypothetical protein
MIATTVCTTCKLLVVDKGQENLEKVYTCKAFPGGIPRDIIFLGWDHGKYPFKGDNGIMYQKGTPTIIEGTNA